MLSIQHVMCGAMVMDPDAHEKGMGALVLSDAIRAYSGPRQYSHFERSEDGKDVSWWAFPSDLKGLTRESVQESLKEGSHLAEGIRPCVLGEETDLGAFQEHNSHLPKEVYAGIEMHLRQDRIFDAFVREQIDCTGRYEDTFVRNGQTMDGKEVRAMIGRMEQYGVYYLAHELYEEKGIVANQEWLETYVKPALETAYPEDLAEKTYSFMKVAEPYNTYITQQDWSHLPEAPDGLSPDDFGKLYRQVFAETTLKSERPDLLGFAEGMDGLGDQEVIRL